MLNSIGCVRPITEKDGLHLGIECMPDCIRRLISQAQAKGKWAGPLRSAEIGKVRQDATVAADIAGQEADLSRLHAHAQLDRQNSSTVFVQGVLRKLEDQHPTSDSVLPTIHGELDGLDVLFLW